MIECKDDSVDKVSRKITAILYNLLSDPNIKSEVFKNNRINYIYDLGEALQNREDIDFDSIKGYINGLLDNLEHLKKFDIGSSELIALSSFAAFIKAPDADVEKLFSVVTSNELTDYRITLGLWGLIHGYSNIPNYYFKQWIEQLDNNDVLQYIDIVNKCIYGNTDYATAESSTESIVQSESLTSNTPELSEPSLFLHEEQENEQTYEQAVEGKKTIKDEVNHTEKCHSQEPKIQNHISCENTSFNESFQEILQKSKEILEAKKPQKKQDTFLSYYINRIEMILNTSTDFAEIIQEIEAIPAQEGKTAWNGAKIKIKKAIKEIEKSHKRKHENSIFDMPITRTDDKQKSFLADEATWGKIAAHLPNNPNLIKKLKDDFDWFRTNYYSGKYETNPKDNHSVLDHFYWFLMRKINESGYHNSYSREYRQLSPDTVERIMNTLKILYP